MTEIQRLKIVRNFELAVGHEELSINAHIKRVAVANRNWLQTYNRVFSEMRELKALLSVK